MYDKIFFFYIKEYKRTCHGASCGRPLLSKLCQKAERRGEAETERNRNSPIALPAQRSSQL